MENRFGLKDLILLVLLVAVIVVLLLGMKQYDRQWQLLQTMQEQQGEQTTELQNLARVMRRLAIAGPTTVAAGTQGDPTTQPADPAFARIRAAEELPGYAQGDTYIVGSVQFEKITPLTTKDAYGSDVDSRVLESLLTRDPVTMAWEPMIAKSLPRISADGLTFTFHLRDDVVFSDGQPLTAKDVLFTYNWIMNPLIECPRERAYYAKLKSVVAVGDYTVVFTFAGPYFKSEEIAGGMGIMPEHFYSHYSPDEYNKAPGLLLGSGPYKMEDPKGWSPGKQLQLVRNGNYWGEPAPFNKVIYKMYGEDIGKLTEFRNGENDTIGVNPDQYRDLLKDQDLMSRSKHYEYSTPGAGYRFVAWNEKRDGKPTHFADKRVRQAMTMLIDRPRICSELEFNLADVISGPFVGKNPQADPSISPWPYDLAKAKDLLKQAGWEDRDGTGVLRDAGGKPFVFELIYRTGNPDYQKMALFLKDAFAKAGIEMQLDPLQWPIFTQKLTNRDFDAITLGWSGVLETDIYQIFSSEQMKDGGDNFVSYSNPQLDELMATARKTMDVPQRMKLWQQCHRILHEDQPYTFLFTPKSLVFIDARFQNVQLLPLGINSDLEWFVPAPQQKYR